jgi:hypothetical protein
LKIESVSKALISKFERTDGAMFAPDDDGE